MNALAVRFFGREKIERDLDEEGSRSRTGSASAAPNTYAQKREVAMAKLIYTSMTSLDGYTEDEEGNFDWAAPSRELHAFVNDLVRPIGTHLFGRRMYETMLYWETAQVLPDQSSVASDFTAIWKAAEKVVYSKTLETVSSARTRIERDFDPEVVLQMKSTAGCDIAIGGPALAAQAIKAGLVDEVHQFVVPIVIGGGKRYLPNNIRMKLELLDERRFGSGTVYLRYGTGRSSTIM